MSAHESFAGRPGDGRPGPEGPRLEELDAEYEILEELGRGGTAVVYRAIERELGREVAIKVVRASHLDDEEAIARLAREAKMIAVLRHPNIVTLFGTRHLTSGGLALVMQCVPGRTLKQAIREEGPFAVDVALPLLREIGSALFHAHGRHGIVHRDIKPENIYLDDEHGHAMLADFGIARAGDVESSLTLVGMALGTPAYMSPEQIEGEPLDGRSDLYSLGLVAYEMLSARQPWEGHNLYTIIYKQKHEDLPPLGELRPDLPPNLLRAIEGCLRKDREQRWHDAAQFLAQLRPSVMTPPPVVTAPRTEPRPVVSEDSPTIRYERDAGEPGADGSPPGPGTATDEPGILPADVLDAIAAGTTPEPAPSHGRLPWRGAFRVAALLLIGFAVVTAGMISEPYLADEGASSAPGVAPDLPPDVVGATPLAGPVETTAAAPARARIIGLAGDGQRGTAGAALPRPLEVRVEDASGRPVPGAEVVFEVVSGAGRVTPAIARADASGIAHAEWTLGEPGLNEVVAAPRGGGEGRASFLAFGSAAGPARLSLDGGAGQEGVRGAALPREIEVRVEDEHGNPLDGVPVEFRVMGEGGSVSPAQVRAVAGVARAAWTLGSALGSQSLVAEVPGTDLVVAVTARARHRLAVQPAVVAGGTHTCRLAASGEAACWGANDNGQLGTGTTARQSGARAAHFDEPLARLAAGVSHSCALDRDGVALCWGVNDEGQLGTGDREERAAPAPVRGVASYVAIEAGLSHTCALGDDGQAYCWGAGRAGQLGDGRGAARATPGPVVGGLRFTALAVGWIHACGLSADREAFCWGENREGQLGDGTVADRATPTRAAVGQRFVGLSAGAAHTCGLTPEGVAVCWGDWGDGDPERSGTEPVEVDAPVPFTATVAGAVHTCALARTGEAYCWGRNGSGQLGNGTTEDSSVAVRVAGGLRFTFLTSTGSHTCGRSVDGADYCWGYNVEGQLGDGSRTHRSYPVRVAVKSP